MEISPPVTGKKYRLGLLVICLSVFFCPFDAPAGFTSQLSLGLGEEYNDNILFNDPAEADFITTISPTLSLFYYPPASTAPIFTADFTAAGQLYLRHTERSNLGDNLSAKAGYTYYFSPRLTLHFSDTLSRSARGQGSLTGASGAPLPTELPPSGGSEPLPPTQQAGGLISNGATLANQVSVRGKFLYAPHTDFNGGLTFRSTSFLDEGGTETTRAANVRGTYKWREEHTLHAGYGITLINSRTGDENIVHSIDVGDDYFSNYKVKFDPSLTVSTTGGISLKSGSGGTRIINNFSLTVKKLWESANANLGIRRGLTESFGLGGVSLTTTFFGDLTVHLRKNLTGSLNLDYSLFDTDTTDSKVLQAKIGLRSELATWLHMDLSYRHDFRDSGAGAGSTTLLSAGKVHKNTISLLFTSYFDLWPNLGLGRKTLPTSSAVGP